MIISNVEYKKDLRATSIEDRRIHAHYTIEAIEDSLTELYNNLLDGKNVGTEKGVNRLAFLKAVSDALETFNEKPILNLD